MIGLGRLRRYGAYLAVSVIAASFVASYTPTHALSDLLPNSGGIYLGIGWHTSFEGYSITTAAYYDNYDANRRIVLSGAGEGGTVIDGGLQCRNSNPPSRPSSWNGTYATVRVDAGSGVSTTYNISRNNFCSGSSSSTVNLRTAPNNARLRGQYQLPIGAPVRDEATGKYKVTVTIRFTTGTRVDQTGGYNPNALFRLRAPGGIMGAVASNYQADPGNAEAANAIGTRVYSDTKGFYRHIFEFGSTCAMNANTRAVIGLRDPDSYMLGGEKHPTQGYNQGVEWQELRFYVEERIGLSGSYTPLASSRYSIMNNSGRHRTVNGHAAIGSTTQSAGGVDDVSPDTLVSFTMVPDGKYRLVVNNAYTRNFLQALIPTDAIYNAIDCDDVRGGAIYPSLTRIGGSGFAKIGDTVNVRPEIFNSDSSNAAESRYEYRVWLDTSNQTYGTGDQQLYYGSLPSSQPPINISAGGRVNLTSRVDTDHTIDSADYASICYSLRALPVSPTEADTGHSNPAVLCVPIGKKPHAQISGGDLIVRNAGSIIHAPSVNVGSDRYGSWGEYGVFGRANVDIYSGGGLMASTNPAEKSPITFANTGSAPGHFGAINPAVMPSLPKWTERTLSSSANVGDLVSRSHYKRSGNVILDGATNLNKQVIIDAGGWIRIDSDIRYANTNATSLRNLPQVIIIADEIRIRPEVGQIDAWLIARSGIVTCGTSITTSPYFSGVRSGVCDSRLTINGPVQTGKALLRRTFGASGTNTVSRRQPAEVFNLREDTYLWAYGQAASEGVIRTETVSELPPRF